MNNLKFPFEAKCSISISNGKKLQRVECELATSAIEIFQSLSFREPSDFTIPLVLKFKDVNVQSFVLSKYNFLVEQIPVDKDFKVAGFSIVPTGVSNGDYIQAFSSFLFIIQAPLGFTKKHKINENSIIKLKS